MNPLKDIKKNIQPAMGLVAGGIGANLLATKLTFITNDKLRAATPILLGIVMMGMKNKMVQNAGMGMIAVGGAKVVGTFIPSLGGITEDDINGLYDRVYNKLDVYSEPIKGSEPIEGSEPAALGEATPAALGALDMDSFVEGTDEENIEDAEYVTDYN